MSTEEKRRWRGLKALIHDAVDVTTELVREGHESSARSVRRVTDRIEPIREPVRVIDGIRRLGTAGVLGTVKGVNRAIEVVTDLGLDAVGETTRQDRPDDDSASDDSASDDSARSATTLVPMRSDITGGASWIGDAALGVVNGVVGDFLRTRDNDLQLGMTFRINDRYVVPGTPAFRSSLSGASPRAALLVHGLGATEWSWCIDAERYHGDPTDNFGSMLERDLGITSIFLRYNTGRHISENGRELALRLEQLFEDYPSPLEELILIGHSMGGLVIRSACHYGLEAGHKWVEHVRRVFCLGSPHAGAPLAKLGHSLGGALGAIDLPATRIISDIIEARSSGIKDLRAGALVDADWLGADMNSLATSTPSIPGAKHYFVSTTVTEDPEHPMGRLIGDLLVRVPSSSGAALQTAHFEIETSHHGAVMHHQLQNHPAIYAQLLDACRICEA